MIPGVIASEWRGITPLAINVNNVNTFLYNGKPTNFGYVSATGGSSSYVFSSTSLPTGLSLDPNTGNLSGRIVAAQGSYPVIFTVTDTSTSFTSSANVTFSVGPGLAIQTGGLNTTGSVGTYYSSSISATGGGGSYSYSIYSGSLPTGLSLNTSTGAIVGTPTAGNLFTVQFSVTDVDGNTVTSSTITYAINLTLTVTTTLGTSAIVQDGSTLGSVTASGGIGPYTYYYSGSLPTGTTFQSSYGTNSTISGTVNTNGNGGPTTVTFYAQDSIGSVGSQQVTYTFSGIVTNALFVAGGGGAGFYSGIFPAGGGGGGVNSKTVLISSGITYNWIVGSGGGYIINAPTAGQSTFWNTTGYAPVNQAGGGSAGSKQGGGTSGAPSVHTGGTQVNTGTHSTGAGGGGGASQNGQAGSGDPGFGFGGYGGVGITSDITGSSVIYGGGGGGGGSSIGTPGGTGPGEGGTESSGKAGCIILAFPTSIYPGITSYTGTAPTVTTIGGGGGTTTVLSWTTAGSGTITF